MFSFNKVHFFEIGQNDEIGPKMEKYISLEQAEVELKFNRN